MNNEKVDNMLSRLSTSCFRSRFKLDIKDKEYINSKGLETIKNHTYDFINKRLKDITKVNDGKQTPYKGHPTFKAQHATATCCRGCLQKWYHIPKDKILSKEDIDFIVNMNMRWIELKYRDDIDEKYIKK